jgi:trans-AT polyketide synthase/acyltransferase/oxidoreductase domain-containing protein
VLQKNELSKIFIANHNSPTQIVIAGPKDDINKAASLFESERAVFKPLKVNGAFHSKYMKPASEEYNNFLDDIEFSNINIPVISNFEARPYNNNIIENLTKQMYSPVKWMESIQYLLEQGCMEFYELGNGLVLTGLIKKIRDESFNIIQFVAEREQIKPSKKTNFKNLEAGIMSNSNIEAASNNYGTEFNRIIPNIKPDNLGSEEYKEDYNLRYAYATGGMYRGIASKELVVRMGKAGMMSYFGTGGLDLESIEDAIKYIQENLPNKEPYGINLINNSLEKEMIELFLKYNVHNLEAAAYIQLTQALVKFRLKGVKKLKDNGLIKIENRIQAKVSRPEIAEQFLSPAPERIVNRLLRDGEITEEEATLSRQVPMADDLCVEADSGGHTDHGVAYALMPAMKRLCDDMMRKYGYTKKVRIGAAGGIGTPEAAAAAFILGADFILTGSINQCTVEAGTSDRVKDLLQEMNVQDTEYAPAGDMFELGAKVQVMKRGLLFPARSNKLYTLYQHHRSLDEIDEKTRKLLEEKYFKRSFESIYDEVKKYLEKKDSAQIEFAEKNPKLKMALIFRWYFDHASRLALSGCEEQVVDYQIQCGPALGAFNQWVKGTELESWHNRHVDQIGEVIMMEASELLNKRYREFWK